jgi:hypothetical protein
MVRGIGLGSSLLLFGTEHAVGWSFNSVYTLALRAW